MLGRIASIALALLALSSVAAAEPLRVRVSWTAPVSDWASIWLEKKDLAANYGKTYVFDAVRYRGTPPMITALANNELEIASLAYSTLSIAVENAGMDDMRVISDNFQDGYDGYYSNEFDVLADGPIHKIEDLKGKVIAMPPAARSTSPCAPCCTSTAWKRTATTPSSKRRSPPCAPCWRRRRPT